jgi:glycosyltransferase involved in cell wall biosynthesis
MKDKRHILIVSSCADDWGGSEELWARSIPFLMERGYRITVAKDKINRTHKQYKNLLAKGVLLHDLNPMKEEPVNKVTEKNLESFLRKNPFSLVLISQGINFDGLGIGYICLRENIPYVMIAQKAVDSFWPYTVDRIAMRNVYLNAEMAYFVSQHNLKLTEEQFGIRFSNAQVISNPVKVGRAPLPYPDTASGYRLACIGRFMLIDKGQDILIRIMAKDKWKARPLKVSFIGSGIDKPGLMEMAQLLNAGNVEFIEQQDDIEQVWNHYHALVMPSRFEGTPLVLLEAMALGRTAIVSTAGGNAELITDGVSGFVGQANEEDFEDAMERAWEARDQWREMGIKACEKLKTSVPELPERDLANALHELIQKESKLVSVIIPTYNRAGIVEAAIQSVLKQTYSPVQLIVADDGSVDETDALMAKYPNITYLKLPHGGQAHARNEGLRHARGTFIATLDSDDTWEANFIERSLGIMENHQLDFVFSNWMQDMGDGQFEDRFSICKVLEETLQNNQDNTIILDNAALRKIYLTGCPSPSSSLLFRRSSFRTNWTSGLRIADDWCLLMDIIYSKPSKGGFTRDILWQKKIDGKNIYDGRDFYDLIRDLWIHDLEFLFDRFKDRLTKAEKRRIRITLSENYLQYSYFQFRHNKKYLPGIKYTSQALLANSRIVLQVFVGFKLKIKKALGRLKRSL